jgi:hypothetical protein
MLHLWGCCAVQAAGCRLQCQRCAVQAEIPLQHLANCRLISCRAADQLRRAVTLQVTPDPIEQRPRLHSICTSCPDAHGKREVCTPPSLACDPTPLPPQTCSSRGGCASTRCSTGAVRCAGQSGVALASNSRCATRIRAPALPQRRQSEMQSFSVAHWGAWPQFPPVD